ncbi:hypothetical protein G7K_2998-t1 [Saitoella complicata NRRL Y-17804]|uniref:Large ribosomal subunit protein uL14m n=2 Tax=Saitoella complicata (strain BCRC 22490 / CBS 7301 / JCM 7358 / NBRC 10748 / NRRL Y-17804) TaxID=698492 RepID=A0A0E9NG55_SAICN|nr:hypothetical protein G7K_2998-t1 [Saitoella complicata NRRL Y-17804]
MAESSGSKFLDKHSKMIALKGLMTCIDNSGALIVECVNTLKAGRFAGIGDECVVVVKKAKPIPTEVDGTAAYASKIRRGEVRHAVIVRTKKETRREDGRYIRFDDNACIILNNKGEPLGTRITGVVAAELRHKKWAKVLSLAPRVVMDIARHPMKEQNITPKRRCSYKKKRQPRNL